MTPTSRAAIAACTLALASLAATAAPAQTGFEGVVTFVSHSKSDGKTTTMVQTTKGSKLKIEGMSAEGGSMILDGDAHTMIMVEPAKKQYITITQADMDQMAAMMKPMAEKMKGMKHDDGKDGSKLDVSKTGRTETVAGTRCEIWHGTTVEDDGTKKEGDVCVAQGVGFAIYDMMMNNPMTAHARNSMQQRMAKYKELMSGGKGVLKITSIENGKPSVDMEATKIEKRSVSDGEFKPPADYTGTSMGAMLQQSAQQMQGLKQKMQDAQKGKEPAKP
ncbi:MAG TPA: DUF4412 domain-containing protein [Gemmatimonadales bacterium]|nr:DUF4412 domain-containing protein [Gemmatimonadales bacterium]